MLRFTRLTGITLCAILLVTASFNVLNAQRLSDYVNTIRGTNNNGGDYSRGGTAPLTTLPHGFTYWTPVTNSETSSWIYQYNHDGIQGFAASHIPSPWINDYASFNLMPEIGSLMVRSIDRTATFSHANETGKAHYYSVKLDNNITAEITPTTHACVMRFTFPKSDSSHILFDSKNKNKGTVTVDATAKTISGYVNDVNVPLFQSVPNIYFYISVSKAFTSFGYPTKNGICANIDFATSNNEQVILKIGTSYISVAQAKANLDSEIGTKTFDVVKEEGAKIWDDLLGKVALQGGADSNKITFYSCLYKSFVYPTSFTETVNGQPKSYSPSDGKIHDGEFYTNNGFWDTYKTAWPLYNLLTPTFSGRMLQGFLNFYDIAGVIARWFGPGLNGSMLGTHTDILFADAYIKGVRNFDYQFAYQNMLLNGSTPNGPPLTGRNDNIRAMYYGYTADDNVTSSASWTLENTICDAAIARMAAALNKKDDSAYYANRSLNYINIFSPSVGGFFRGKKLDGSWRTSDASFKPNEWGYEFVEGNAWQYRIAPLQDGQGLANLFGGRAALATAIDDVFNAPREYLPGSYGGTIHEMKEAYDTDMGQYAQCNQTDHGMIYMYNYAGTPAKTAQHARAIMKLFSSGVGTGDGYSGDEDNGSQSSWFVFSALGLFPAAAAVPEYLIGSPIFGKATLSLENGKTFTVTATNNNGKNIYVQSATLNGVNYTKNFITHADILKGGTLVLKMGTNPSTWGTGVNDVPTSISKTSAITVMKDIIINGVVTASGQASTNDAKEKAFDNSGDSRWAVNNDSCWIQYELPVAKSVAMYTITSSDNSKKDPKNWRLKGSNNGSTWTTLDTKINQQFIWRQQLKSYSINNKNAYKYYRLEMINNGDKATQVAEIELFATQQVNGLTNVPVAVK